MPEEEYKPNTSIYYGTENDPEREKRKQAEQRALRAKLPKFTLAEGEVFYVDRNTIKTLHKEYFEMLNEMRSGFTIAPEEMQSYMQSVVSESYKSEILELQRKGKQKAIPLKEIESLTNEIITPDYEKKWWQRRWRPNKSMKQCQKLAELAAVMELSAQAEEIARQEEFVYGESKPPQEIEELYGQIIYEFIPPWRQRGFVKKHGERLMEILTEYTQQVLYLANLRESKNGKAPEPGAATPAPSEEAQPEQAAESEEPDEPAEDVEDDLSALYALADEPDVEEPAAPEEVQEQPEQAAAAPEEATDVADDVEQVQMLMPQSENVAEPEEPDTGANADEGEDTETE